MHIPSNQPLFATTKKRHRSNTHSCHVPPPPPPPTRTHAHICCEKKALFFKSLVGPIQNSQMYRIRAARARANKKSAPKERTRWKKKLSRAYPGIVQVSVDSAGLIAKFIESSFRSGIKKKWERAQCVREYIVGKGGLTIVWEIEILIQRERAESI